MQLEKDVHVSKHFAVTTLQSQDTTKLAGGNANADTKKQKSKAEEAAEAEATGGPVEQYDSSVEANKNREKQIDEV
eukprot:CAMPEP_0170456948 /NCGR_PEP_ID=MMETSP0123-20130129/4403_1 /TAXON_ID=182087 /ORGANISM="Favella ehrenbergii, Strain Fehren 1" /LENGTH=75 /DNA_ID=CAMNT_0010720577 /DNA_START=756 /DNA_END=983 /DNA_ORIENTATION=-